MITPLTFFREKLSEALDELVPLDEIRLCEKEGVDVYTPYLQGRSADFSIEGFSFEKGFLNWRIDDQCLLQFSNSFLETSVLCISLKDEKKDIENFTNWHGEGEYIEQVYTNPLFCLRYAHAQCCYYLNSWPQDFQEELSLEMNEEMRKMFIQAISISSVLARSEQKRDKSLYSAYASQLAQRFLIWYNAHCVLDVKNQQVRFFVQIIQKSLSEALAVMEISMPESF